MSGELEVHQCPTRKDDRPVLLAHQITPSMCQKRQRERYHKCYTCKHYNNAAPTNLVKLPGLQQPKRSELIAS